MYTELKAQPGDYVFSDSGLVVGRINNDLTEDNRFTAFGKCSIANGFINATNLTPTNARSFHNSVESNPNGYVLKGYTICLQLKELPVEMWAVKAAEILDGEFEDFEQMLEELSKQPEKERQAKLSVLAKFFTKEKTHAKTKERLTPAAKQNVDMYIEEMKERWNEDKEVWLHSYNKYILFDMIEDGESIEHIPPSFYIDLESWLTRIKFKAPAFAYFDEKAKTIDIPDWQRKEDWIKREYEKEVSKRYESKLIFAYYLLRKREGNFTLDNLSKAYHDTGLSSFDFGEYKPQAEKLLKKLLSNSKPIDKSFDVRHRYFYFTEFGPSFYSRGRFTYSNTTYL